MKIGHFPGSKLNHLDHLTHASVSKMTKEAEEENRNRSNNLSFLTQVRKNSAVSLEL